MLSAYILKDKEMCKVYAWRKELRHEVKGFYLCKYSEPVFLRRPVKKVHHFAHYSNSNKNYEHKEETEEHRQMKKSLCDYFSEEFFSDKVASVDVEHYVYIDSNKYLESDVFIEMKSGKDIVFECQTSNIPVYKIEEKYSEYSSVGLICIYVYPKRYRNKLKKYPYLTLINKENGYIYKYYIPELSECDRVRINNLFDFVYFISNREYMMQKIMNDKETDDKKENKRENLVVYSTIIGYTVEGYPCFMSSDNKIKFKTPEGYVFDLSMSSSKYIKR